MAKVLICVYSSGADGCLAMAEAAAVGVKSTGATCDVRRVPELSIVEQSNGLPVEGNIEMVAPEMLKDYDGILFVCPSRMGIMVSAMKAFLERTGKQWAKGELAGKVAGSMVSTERQHDGHETANISMLTSLMHHGFIVAGLPPTFSGLSGLEEVKGGTPYGASALSTRRDDGQPSGVELDACHYQGRYLAEVAAKLRRR